MGPQGTATTVPSQLSSLGPQRTEIVAASPVGQQLPCPALGCTGCPRLGHRPPALNPDAMSVGATTS